MTTAHLQCTPSPPLSSRPTPLSTGKCDYLRHRTGVVHALQTRRPPDGNSQPVSCGQEVGRGREREGGGVRSVGGEAQLDSIKASDRQLYKHMLMSWSLEMENGPNKPNFCGGLPSPPSVTASLRHINILLDSLPRWASTWRPRPAAYGHRVHMHAAHIAHTAVCSAACSQDTGFKEHCICEGCDVITTTNAEEEEENMPQQSEDDVMGVGSCPLLPTSLCGR